MHDSVKGSGAKRNNRLYENVWIECKESTEGMNKVM